MSPTASPPQTPDLETRQAPEAERRSEPDPTERLRAVLRERCGRLSAPDGLRQRILATLPHRGQGAE